MTAWQRLRQLREPAKLRAWLCGIARGLTSNAIRRQTHQPVHAAAPLDTIHDLPASAPTPDERAITREEEAILWRSLERIPEAYREPLVLFYREYQSVEKVATALELSEDAVKQRLSRGRKLLHEEVLAFVEGALARTNPGKSFTLALLGTLPLFAASASAATVGAGAVKAGITSTLTNTLFMTTKTKTLILAGLVVAAASAPVLWQRETNRRLRREITALRLENWRLATSDPATPTVPSGANSLVPPAGRVFNWRAVESSDYRQYIANLRAIGCPEETIRDIIIADVNKLFAERLKSQRTPGSEFKYWQTGAKAMLAGAMDVKGMAMRSDLASEKRALLKELIGEEMPESPGGLSMNAMFDHLLDFLPDDSKRAKLMNAMQTLEGAKAKLDYSQPDAARQEFQLKQQFMAQLAACLTPEELEQYQLRLHPEALRMRLDLDGFSPTEEEFRRIFDLRKTCYEQCAGDTASPAAAAARQQLDLALSQLLGDQRYAQYQQAQEPAFQAFLKFARGNKVADDSALAAYGIQKTAQASAREVRRNVGIAVEQREAALQGIRRETEHSLQQVLGERTLHDYLGTDQAAWLKMIAP